MLSKVAVQRMSMRIGAGSARVAGARALSHARIVYNANNTSGGSEQSTPPPPPPKSNLGLIAGLVVAGGVAYYGYDKFVAGGSLNTGAISSKVAKITSADQATFDDYQKVYNAIAKKLQDDDEYDDGSYGPVLVRLAWHASGTYDVNAGNGGSGPGTMRFDKEYGTDSNKGLNNGTTFLEPIHEQFPWISYGDLYTLGGICAVQEMGGPTIKWRCGRIDQERTSIPPDGRLPDATKGQAHIRDVFYRMGFNDQEIVALIGAHCLGRCHTQNSGFDGPWTFSPTTFTNDFFKLLVEEKWHWRKWNGPKQLQDDATNSLMMLPADYALVQDKKFKEWVQKYAKDNDLFFSDFSKAFSKLLELGVKFKDNTPHWEFKTYEASN